MKRTLTASIIILAGVLLLLANMEVTPIRGLVESWWPIVFIAIGGLILWNDRQNYVWALLFAGLGSVLLLNNLGAAHIDFGDILLPAIIVAVGLSMLVSTTKKPPASVSTAPDEEVASFVSGTTTKVVSDDYTGTKVSAVMGGVELDLSKAVIKKSAVLNVFVLMGGVDVKVAENVVIKNRSSVLMGGIEDKTSPVISKNAPVLYIDGTVLMGGLEIKH